MPPDGDADQADAPDVTFELTEAEVLRVKIAYALTHYWYLYGSVVLLVCFGIAFLLQPAHSCFDAESALVTAALQATAPVQ